MAKKVLTTGKFTFNSVEYKVTDVRFEENYNEIDVTDTGTSGDGKEYLGGRAERSFTVTIWMQAGDADIVFVPREFVDQVTPYAAISCRWDSVKNTHVCEDVEGAEDQPLIVYFGHPRTDRDDVFFVWDVAH